MTTATGDQSRGSLKAEAQSAFDFKSASIDGLGLVLKCNDLKLLASQLSARFDGTQPSNTPVLIDVSKLGDSAAEVQLDLLVAMLRRYALQPVGIVGASGMLLESATRMGLTEAADIGHLARRRPVEVPIQAATPPDSCADLQRLEAAHQAAIQTAVLEAVEGLVRPPIVVDGPLRSGQRIYAQGCDLIVRGLVSHGAEVIADGNVHVYGPLRGLAIAGARGNEDARIYSTCMEPALYAISGIYMTTETPLPESVQGKPASVRLEGEKLIVEPLGL